MRAAPGMHVEWIEDEAVVLNPETGQLHYLNAPAAVVYAMVLEYGFDEAIRRVEEDHQIELLDALVAEMTKRGLLEDG